MTTFAVRVRGNPVTFDSPFTDAEALEKLKNVPGRFASDLLNRRHLSGPQMAWVHKLVVDAGKPTVAVDADFSGVIALFDKANAHLKYPKIALDVDGVEVKLQRCGERSSHPGCVNVTDGGGYGNSRWYGRIERDGSLTSGRALTDEVRALLINLAKDPAHIAAEYGKRTGNCCFCCRALTDERSVSVGYGPVCAQSYGLPWGETKFTPVEPAAPVFAPASPEPVVAAAATVAPPALVDADRARMKELFHRAVAAA